MPKKKVTKASSSSSSQDLFKEHKNLKWLIPLFLVSLLLLILVVKHRGNDVDSGGDHSAVVKDRIEQKNHMDNDKETNDDKVSPTSVPSGM